MARASAPAAAGFAAGPVAAVCPAVAVFREGGSNVMVAKTLEYLVVLACGALALAGPAATADDKKGDKPALSGSWGKKGGELKIEFADKAVLKIAPHGDSAVIAIVCDYTVGKGGLVKAKVTGFEGKEEAKKHLGEKVPVGTEFSFKWKVKDDTAKLDDLKCVKVEQLKSHLEGDFEKK
jgi:hypothetical protein